MHKASCLQMRLDLLGGFSFPLYVMVEKAIELNLDHQLWIGMDDFGLHLGIFASLAWYFF